MKMRFLEGSRLFLILFWASLLPASGATIVYNFNDGGSLAAVKSGADAGNINATDFAAPGDASVSSSTFTAFLRSQFTGNSLSAALADADYFTFTLTPTNAGETWQVNSLNFQFGASTGGAGTSLTNTVVVQTSFAGTGPGKPTLEVLPSDTKATGQTDGGNSFTSAAATVSGINFSSTSPLEVQFRFYDNMDVNELINRLDNISIDVSAVPEPSTALLSLFGLGGALFLRHRRAA